MSSYERQLERMYQQQLADFNNYSQPLIDQIEQDAVSTSISDRARVNASKLGGRVQQVSSRQLQYSEGSLLASQRAAIGRQQQRGVALAGSANQTQANQQQKIQHRNARLSLMSIAENLQNTGVSGMATVQRNKQTRDDLARRNKRGLMSQIGAIAGGAIGFFSGGGPQGALVGSQIGSGIGGAIGG